MHQQKAAFQNFGVWNRSAPPLPSLPRLEDSLSTDTVIVGAGYTGLSTALHLAEQGAMPILIESEQPGWGGSGRNAGWMEPNWWLKQPKDISACFGAQRGTELTRWVGSGPRLLKEWISRYQFEIDFDQRGLIMATDQESKARNMQSEVRDWQAAGIENEFLDSTAITDHFGSDRYRGAILLREGATLNPLALSRELARACTHQGVSIFTRTPALSINYHKNSWHIATPRGSIESRQLVLATDAYTNGLWPALRRAYGLWRVAVIASKPYPPLSGILRSGVPFADLNMGNLFTFRTTGEGRLVTSTASPVRDSLSPRAVAEPFMRKFRKVFPALPPPDWEHVHYGDVAVSTDMMPRICKIGPNAWTAYGYSGTGINLALLLGGQLSELACGTHRTLYPVTELQSMAARKPLEWGLRYLYGPVSRTLLSRWP